MRTTRVEGEMTYSRSDEAEWILKDKRGWRKRAEEVRTIAEYMKQLDARATMMRIADEYDRLAEIAEEDAARVSNSRRRMV